MQKNEVCGCCGSGRPTSRALVILKPEEQKRIPLLGKEAETPPGPVGKSGGEQVVGEGEAFGRRAEPLRSCRP